MSQTEGFSKTTESTVLKVAIVIIAIVAVAMLVWIFLLRPYPLVTAETTRQDGHQFYVDVSVSNNGADGWVKVYTQIESAVQFEVKDTRLFMARGEIKSLAFTFTLKDLQERISYKAWAQTD